MQQHRDIDAAVGARSELTSQEYWGEFWKSGHKPSLVARSGLRGHVHQQFLEVLRPLVEDSGPNGRWLEAGCAYSQLLTSFPRHFGIPLEGLDYEPNAVVETRALLRELDLETPIHCADVRSPGELEAVFDGIFSAGLVEHFTDTIGIHRDLARFVKPGGLVVSFVPNLNGINGMLQLLANESIYDSHRVLGVSALTDSTEAANREVVTAAPLVGIDLAVANFGRSRAPRVRKKSSRGYSPQALRVGRRRRCVNVAIHQSRRSGVRGFFTR